MDLGERIAVLREEQAMSQVELAEKAKISPSTLSQIESGRVPRPHVGTVRKIARALGIEPAELRRAKEEALPKGEAPVQGLTVGSERSVKWNVLQAVGSERTMLWDRVGQILALVRAGEITHDEGREQLRRLVA